MSQEVTYYNVLSAAVSELEHDSFAARGAVYDRWWQGILKQLRANAAYSEDDIARERAAFLRAIQWIEFGEGQPQQADHLPQARNAADIPIGGQTRLPRGRAVGRIAARVMAACATLFLAGILAALIAMYSDPAAATKWGSDEPDSWRSQAMRAVLAFGNLIDLRSAKLPSNAQRAVLYEERGKDAAGAATHVGRAIWQTSSDASASADSGPVLSIDVEIPQKDLALKISLQRGTDGGAVISHFVEFRFTGPNQSPSDAVVDVVGILMKNDELSRGIELVGKIVNVHPGVFLMGLSGAEADVSRNLALLRDRPWLDIPIVLKGGSRSILAIEKGSTGQNAVKEALSTWGQRVTSDR
jgi:hypothetical protein